MNESNNIIDDVHIFHTRTWLDPCHVFFIEVFPHKCLFFVVHIGWK